MTAPPPAARPWLTGVIVAAALLGAVAPAVAPHLRYERAAILAGEVWRLATGHLVHFGAGHLAWNLVVLIPSAAWAERLAPRATRRLLLGAPLAMGLTLLVGEPALERYGGLSGLATATLVLLALLQLDRPAVAAGPRWWWRTVLALVGAKLVAEFAGVAPRFAAYDEDAAIRTVPLVHASGALAALLAAACGRRG